MVSTGEKDLNRQFTKEIWLETNRYTMESQAGSWICMIFVMETMYSLPLILPLNKARSSR